MLPLQCACAAAGGSLCSSGRAVCPPAKHPLLPLPPSLLLPAYSPLSCLLPAGSVIRDHGLIEIQPDAPAPSGDGLPTAAALDATSAGGNGNEGSSSLLVNVNNRLVSRCLPPIPLAALHQSGRALSLPAPLL